MSAPGWQTGDLVEEWVESSPSPPTLTKPLPTETLTLDADSVRAKRGSLRALGHAAPRSLPTRSASASSPRIISGHGEGRVLSERMDNVPLNRSGDLPSPPNSSGEEPVAGTFVVKDGVDDDRGRHLARHKGGRDMFGPTALEKMFQPPSPPQPTTTQNPSPPPPTVQATQPVSTTPSPAPLDVVRRASNPYAPANPSRLSKSVTPSSASGSSFSASQPVEFQDEGEGENGSPDGSQASDEMRATGSDGAHGQNSQSLDIDVSPIAKGTKYSFTFEAPVRSVSDNSTKSNSPNPFDPALSPFNYGEASHSTLHRDPHRRPSNDKPALKLFRSTYDTYTREHLSALVDSIAIEPSPSPPSAASGSNKSSSRVDESEDIRSSKRMRMSPSSPARRPSGVKEWGFQGRSMLDKLRASNTRQPGESTEAGEPGEALDYTDIPPSPPLVTRPSRPAHVQHRSNPSTASAGYLRAAEELMARIKARPVSESSLASTDHSPESDSHPTATSSEWEAAGLALQREKTQRHQSTDRPTHRSNPSTNSSGYLRAAEQLMAKIKARPVSESSLASTSEQSMGTLGSVGSRRPSSDKWESGLQKDKGKGKAVGPSPRRILRRLSASEEVKRAADESSGEEGQSNGDGDDRHNSEKARLAERRPTSQASSGDRANRVNGLMGNVNVNIDDLNRFVSATTQATATTMSTSFVKHPGPRAARPIHVIRPEDIHGVVPDRVGKMRYDKVSMRWVRDGLGRVDEATESRGSRSRSEESEDVFAGMDSWGRSAGRGPTPPVEPIQEEYTVDESDVEGAEEAEEDLMQHADTTQMLDEPSSESESERSDVSDDEGRPHNEVEDFIARPSEISPHRPVPHHASSAPAIMTPTPNLSAIPRPIRSALRNTNSLTPGMKKRAQWHESVTPAAGSSARRSVSFSDGKKSGRIQELHPDSLNGREAEDGDEEWFRSTDGGDGKSWISVRTKRIEGILGDMEELSLDDGTPSKPPRPLVDSPVTEGDTTIQQVDRHRSFRDRADANATFLTECSFGVAHDRLIQLITDVYGSEPYWEQLKVLDLRGKRADSVARLKEFLPELDEVNLNDNKISYLSGIPSGVRSLHVANNRLSGLTSVDHLRNLQYLDVSKNQLDSVTQLTCLKHLRELKADGNAITDLNGLMEMDCLLKLSVRGNKVTRVDLDKSQWQKLEVLDLSNNRIEGLSGLHKLTALRELTIEGNELSELRPSRPMLTVRTLRVSDNKLSALDLSLFPKLRTLYADRNSLKTLNRSVSGMSRLENLSVRNQAVRGLHLSHKELEHVRRLYISGNPLGGAFFPGADAPLYAMVYLEAAACDLSKWPAMFAKRLPNLRILNMNYNYFENLDGVVGMVSLRKISVVGARLGAKEGKGVMRGLKGLDGLEEIDLRMNPSTLPFYLPVMVPPKPTVEEPPSPPARQNPLPSVTLAVIKPPQVPDGGLEWAKLDGQFRRALPDEWYGKRLVYRGLVMGQCPRLRLLDGVRIEEGERKKAERLIEVASGTY